MNYQFAQICLPGRTQSTSNRRMRSCTNGFEDGPSLYGTECGICAVNLKGHA